MVIFRGCGRRNMASSERAVPPAWPSRTPYKSVPKNQGRSRGTAHLPLEPGAGEHVHLPKLGEHGHLPGLRAEEHGHLLKLGRHGHFLGLREHGHLLGLRAEDHGHLPSELCRLLGHHEPMSSPLIVCHLICLHERHQNLNRHPIVTSNFHRCQKCVK